MNRGGLARARAYPLSDGDLRKLLGNDISILTYPDLAMMKHIDQCFDDKGRCILLFLTTSENSGHWCCLLNKKEGIEFFDSYGEAPEEQLENLSEERRAQLNESYPYLLKLLKASGRPIFYNTYPFQKTKNDIATCGRHAAVRCLYAPYSLDRYKEIISKSSLSPDDFVVGVTYDKIGK